MEIIRGQASKHIPTHSHNGKYKPLGQLLQTIPEGEWLAVQQSDVKGDSPEKKRDNDPIIYEWSVTEEQTIYSVPALTLIPPYLVDPPTGLTLSHQTVTFGIGASGSGILVSWTPSDDAYVVSTAIQYQLSGASTWISAGSVPQQNSQSGIAPLGSGTYNVEIAAVRSNGASSTFVSATITF
jgi:hypothetical protein